jgi:hypothetical protein
MNTQQPKCDRDRNDAIIQCTFEKYALKKLIMTARPECIDTPLFQYTGGTGRGKTAAETPPLGQTPQTPMARTKMLILQTFGG